MVQRVKNLHEMQETQVQSLGWEDPLEKGMATHSSILAGRTSWTEQTGGLQFIGSQRVGHDWLTHTHNVIIEGAFQGLVKYVCPDLSFDQGTKETSSLWDFVREPDHLYPSWKHTFCGLKTGAKKKELYFPHRPSLRKAPWIRQVTREKYNTK